MTVAAGLLRTRVAVTAGGLGAVGLRGGRAGCREEGALEGRDERRGDRGGGHEQRGDEGEDQADAGARGAFARVLTDVVEATRRVEDVAERAPRGEHRESGAELAEVEPRDLRGLRQAPGDDDERGTDDSGQHDAEHDRAAAPQHGEVDAVGDIVERVEVEERRDEEQHRCSEHHAIASSEGADIHFRSFVGRLIVGRGVAVTMSASGLGVARGWPLIVRRTLSSGLSGCPPGSAGPELPAQETHDSLRDPLRRLLSPCAAGEQRRVLAIAHVAALDEHLRNR